MSTLQTRSHYEITERNRIQLVVRQQPVKARLCSFKEKVDRRPVDPPPIVQLIDRDNDPSYLQNPYFFLYATLATTTGDDLHFSNNTRTTAGSVVQSLHKLKDVDNRDGGFFIFADISVRHEGFFKLKFTLFKIEQSHVFRICSIFSDPFQVYSPKTFPGMSESTFLTRCFSDQGVRIRIRKETRASGPTKRRKTEDHDGDRDPVSPFIVHDSGEGSSSSRFRLPVTQVEPATPIPYLQHHQPQHHTALSSSTSSVPMLPPPPSTTLPLTATSSSPSSTADVSYSMHAMSMQNLLLSPQQQQQQQKQQQHSDSNYGYTTTPNSTTVTTATIPTATTSMMTDEPRTVAEGAPPPTSQSLFTQSLQLPPIVRRPTIQQTAISASSPSLLPSTTVATLEPSSSTGSTSSSSNPSIQPSSIADDYFIHTSNNNTSSTTSITEGPWFSQHHHHHHYHHPQHHPQYQYHHQHHHHHSSKDDGSPS